ncbi:MAG TPA: ATP-binding protein [Desulfomicrobiaceae bacterium]|nr:ATP-binding protein [Desulfomicrobiaceae bacterium]
MHNNTLDYIDLNTSETRERRKRQRELFLAFCGVLLIIVLTWAELKLLGLNSYIFLGLFNLNLILLILVLFLVLRNVVKLALERRRKVLGSRLRTRLVLAFVALSIIPTLLMYLISIRFVQTSVDYWFKAQVENSMQQALEVGQTFYSTAKERLNREGENILDQIRDREFVWGGKGMDAFLEEKAGEYGASLVGILSPNQNDQNWHAQDEWSEAWPAIKAEIPWPELKEDPQYWSALWPGPEADLVLGVIPVDKGQSGFLILGATIGQGLLFKLDQIVQGVDEYKQLRSFKYPLKVALYVILGIMTLLIVFGAMWFGFRLAKEISAPVQALAMGTQRIAQGDLGVRLVDDSKDELGVLVRSFNSMAEDLQRGQEGLQRANVRLARQNLELESKSRYMQAVLDNITAGVVTLDRNRVINTVNKAAESIMGIQGSLLIGQAPLKLLTGSFRELVQDLLDQLQGVPGSQWQRQVDLELGGNEVLLLVNAVALESSEGEDIGVVAVFEDITELEKIQRLAAWKEVARRIAHEIKNPLTPIKLSAQRLQRKFGNEITDPVFAQCTGLVVRQVEHLQSMVQDFSSFAKLPEVKLQTESLVPLVEEVVGEFRSTYNHIHWKISAHTSLPRVRFDPEAMKRVLMNLLLNAVEAMENKRQGEVRVSLSFDPKRSRIIIEISDNGVGLSVEEQSRMFEPYYSRKKGGTGLGLAIVRSVITDHHGTIRVRGGKLAGTVFSIELPAVKEDEAKWSYSA